jgi:dTDP-4-amino-4,6-dideoxygalactose transaminase
MLEAFLNVYDSNTFILGNNVTTFESKFSEFIGSQETVGVASGLDALILALRALGIGNGDEVIVPSNTYIASVLAISHVGAIPVLVEPDIVTYNITADGIKQAITDRTKAVIPVHLYGQACCMSDIMELAAKHNLYVVEDNAQAQGATYNEQVTGSWGHINATSFYPGKNLGALGDGGAVTTNNSELAEQVQKLRNYGSSKKYYNDIIGFNSRLDEMQASFLNVKLDFIKSWTKSRQSAAEIYLSKLESIGDLILPITASNASHVYHLFVIRTKSRNELQDFLSKEGIGSLIHYPVPPHLQKAYAHLGYKESDFPISELLANTCLSLPIYPGITEEQITQVCNSIKKFFSKA